MLDNVKIFNCSTSYSEDEFFQTITKYVFETANYCISPVWRAQVRNTTDGKIDFELDFGIGSGIVKGEMDKEMKNDHLETVYYEVGPDNSGKPCVKKRCLSIVFIAKEKTDEENIAVKNTLYRHFAENIQKAFGFYEQKIIRRMCFVGKEPISVNY